MGWAERLEEIFLAGFEEDILSGMLFELLSQITPEMVYEYIKGNNSLTAEVLAQDWEKYRRLSQRFDIERIISPDYVLSVLKKKRPDLAGIILNSPQGLPWLSSQATEIKRNLCGWARA